ncbi:hypothetical protein C1H46_029121 [Malus baccata]|uniref:Uncharacterized protein n=1 Tax=Malus baccata TaxID=106549 RepID=A0A540LGA6_MALBA|nr:hypothetical protein C1H46_029121 [Malus baccata]
MDVALLFNTMFCILYFACDHVLERYPFNTSFNRTRMLLFYFHSVNRGFLILYFVVYMLELQDKELDPGSNDFLEALQISLPFFSNPASFHFIFVLEPSLFSTSPLALPKAETKPTYAGIKSQVSDTHRVVHISIDKDEQKRI